MVKTYTFLYRNMHDDNDRIVVVGAQDFIHSVKLFQARNQKHVFEANEKTQIVSTEDGDYIVVKIK